jgi:hypothetical protein
VEFAGFRAANVRDFAGSKFAERKVALNPVCDLEELVEEFDIRREAKWSLA